MTARAIRSTKRRLAAAGLAGALLLALLAVAAPSPAAAAPLGWWHLTSAATPTYIPVGGEGTISAAATNLGSGDIDGAGETITLSDRLPAGLKIASVKPILCGVTATGILCGAHWPTKNETAAPSCKPVGESEAQCSFPEAVSPFERIELLMTVKAQAGLPSPTTVTNTVEVTGGKLAPTSVGRPVRISNEPVPFGVETYEVAPEDATGAAQTQAGSHPYQFSTTFAFNKIFHEDFSGHVLPTVPTALKNLHVNLPSGLIGNASQSVLPQCSVLQFATLSPDRLANQCPPNTAIGVAVFTLIEPSTNQEVTFPEPVYNVVPSQGEPARFGFNADGTPITLDTVVREGDYHVVVNVSRASNAVALLSSEVTIWGVPGDESHDSQRGSQCLAREAAKQLGQTCEPPNPRNTNPFLTLPTSCAEPLRTTQQAQSWLFGASPLEEMEPTQPTETLTGCEALPFAPSISATPEEQQSNTPSGLTVKLTVPQTTTLEEKGLAEAEIRNTTVRLPAGVQLSPSAANGLEACSEAQVGYRGLNRYTQTPEFNEKPVSEEAPSESSPGSCPKPAKVGTVRIKTPVLEHELAGSVYLAAQEANPFGSLFGLYIIVEDPISGTLVKLAGKVTLDESTGQITSTFPNAPQLPFEELELKLFGGPRASIATPRKCGAYSTFASFTSWATPAALEASLSGEEFTINGGPGGSPCPGERLPFGPGFQTGSVNNQAGAFTPFSLVLTRPETDQELKSLSMTLPPGIAGVLSQVKQCPEPQASEGTCGPESLIGHATAVAGLGPDPFFETGGRVYITGPYHGAPFGLSIVIPTVTKAFDFGPVVTRSTISVDPNTAQLTIGSELPTMISTRAHPNTGVPVQLRSVDVTVERPEGKPFQFNPTNCEPMTVSATLGGDEGASAGRTSGFQVAGCDKLPFAPKLAASTKGTASKPNGANLNVTLTSAGLGQANIRKVFLQLPKALPSRLTTIQKACPAATFAANPASCDEGSLIGHATIHTPVLTSALSGPAYLVSYGNAKFPDVEFVLQGEGVTLLLDGKTDIKNGITYSRFESAPDAPFTTFETELPTGPHSALTAYTPATPYNLCATSLLMPTEITAQNGDVIKQNTKIAVSGCPPTVKITKTKAKAKALLVTFTISQTGTVKISGKGLKSVTKRGVKAGSHTISVRLTKSGRKLARRHKKVKVTASLTVGHTSATASTKAKV